MKNNAKYIRRLEDLSSKDVSLVGGKNASLGEIISTQRINLTYQKDRIARGR